MARSSRSERGGSSGGNIEFYLGWLLGLAALLAYYFIPGQTLEQPCATEETPAIEQPVEADGDDEAEPAPAEEPEENGGFFDRVGGMFGGGGDEAEAPGEAATDDAVSEDTDAEPAPAEAEAAPVVDEPAPATPAAAPVGDVEADDASVVDEATDAVEALTDEANALADVSEELAEDAGDAAGDVVDVVEEAAPASAATDAAETTETTEATEAVEDAASDVADEVSEDAAAEDASSEETAPTGPTDASMRVEPPFDGLRTNQAVIDLIKEHEGLRLEAYQGPSGAWLIGYGHGGDDVAAGRSITEAQAEALLVEDLAAIESVIKSVVTVPLNANELSAMVDLAYNIGSGSFRTSSVLRSLNEGDRAGAADAFLLWNKVTMNGVQTVNDHLTARRELERSIFLGERNG